MKYVHNHKFRHRRGLTLSELVIAMAIAVAAMAGIAKLMYLVTRQYRVVTCRNVVTEEAANIMEDLMSRPWKAIATKELPSVELSKACRQAVPDAKLQLEIVPEEDQDNMRRITVRIAWQINGSQHPEPIQLVAWRSVARHSVP